MRKNKITNTDVVYDILKDDYKHKQIEFVRAAIWNGPKTIKLNKIDIGNRFNWQINNKKVKKFARKMMLGETYSPIILISSPDNKKLQILNGHHHMCAAIKNKQKDVLAFVAIVESADGPWKILERNQDNGYTSAKTELSKKKSKE